MIATLRWVADAPYDMYVPPIKFLLTHTNGSHDVNAQYRIERSREGVGQS
jgi:glucan phosphoethanolaminetransferase (alkaline phosphatase superfamily)